MRDSSFELVHDLQKLPAKDLAMVLDQLIDELGLKVFVRDFGYDGPEYRVTKEAP